MEKSEEEGMAGLDAYLIEWQQIAERVRAQIAPAARDMQSAMQRVPALEGLQKTFQHLPLRTQEAILLLGAHGWYFDLDMTLPQLWKLKTALADGNEAEVEEALANYFECRCDKIERSIIERFPRRGHLIRAAFVAHRRQEYELSVPVLLAQTDGICKDAINQYLFRKRDKKPSTAIYVEQITVDEFSKSLLSPLARTLPINASENERAGDANALNRHTVLHGESLNYGTKTNSLKAISLINYVAHILTTDTTGAEREEVTGTAALVAPTK